MSKLVFNNKEDELIEYCQSGDLVGVKRLIEEGVNISHKDYRAVRFAANNGHIDILSYLIDIGVDPGHGEGNFLKHAAGNGQFEAVKYLIGKGVDPKSQSSVAFVWACHSGHADIAMYLKSCGADPHVGGDDGFKRAWMKNHQDVCRLLIKDNPDYYQQMVQDYASMMDSDWLQSLLLNQNISGGNPRIKAVAPRVKI